MLHLKSNTPMSAQMGIYKMWALPLKITASVWKLGSALDLCNVPLCASHRAPRVSSECPEISVQTFNTRPNDFNLWIIFQLFSRHNVTKHSCYHTTIDFLVRGKYEPLSQEGNWLLVSCDEQLPAVCRKESRNPVNHSAQSWDEGCPKVGTWTGKVHAHTLVKQLKFLGGKQQTPVVPQRSFTRNSKTMNNIMPYLLFCFRSDETLNVFQD